jgi:hypothetical protein
MSDDPFTERPAPAEPTARTSRRRWPWLLAGVFLTPLLVLALWTAIALTWSYSRGERVGFVLKFSEKGWLCKTWEGELSMATVPGVAPEKWTFSVRDGELARRIQSMQGQHVSLEYEQHKFIPTSCFGETEYFVTEVRAVPSSLPVTPGTLPVTPVPVPVQP